MEVVDVLMLLGGRESFLLKSAMIHCATRFHWWRVKASENAQQNTFKTTREDARKKEFFFGALESIHVSTKCNIYMHVNIYSYILYMHVDTYIIQNNTV